MPRIYLFFFFFDAHWFFCGQGETVVYSVRVTNAKSLSSADDSCTSVSTVVGAPADLVSFFAVTAGIIVVGLLLFACIALFIVHRRHPNAVRRRLLRMRELLGACVRFRCRRRPRDVHDAESALDGAPGDTGAHETALDLLECAGSEPAHGQPRLTRTQSLHRAFFAPALARPPELPFHHDADDDGGAEAVSSHGSTPNDDDGGDGGGDGDGTHRTSPPLSSEPGTDWTGQRLPAAKGVLLS